MVVVGVLIGRGQAAVGWAHSQQGVARGDRSRHTGSTAADCTAVECQGWSVTPEE